MSLFSRGTFAVAFGAFLLCAETCLHAADLIAPASWVDLPIHDWVAGAFLVTAGVLTRRDWTTGRLYQAAAWAFMTSLLFAAFVGHWAEWSSGGQGNDWMSEGAFLTVIGALLLSSTCGLISTLNTRERPTT